MLRQFAIARVAFLRVGVYLTIYYFHRSSMIIQLFATNWLLVAISCVIILPQSL